MRLFKSVLADGYNTQVQKSKLLTAQIMSKVSSGDMPLWRRAFFSQKKVLTGRVTKKNYRHKKYKIIALATGPHLPCFVQDIFCLQPSANFCLNINRDGLANVQHSTCTCCTSLSFDRISSQYVKCPGVDFVENWTMGQSEIFSKSELIIACMYSFIESIQKEQFSIENIAGQITNIINAIDIALLVLAKGVKKCIEEYMINKFHTQDRSALPCYIAIQQMMRQNCIAIGIICHRYPLHLCPDFTQKILNSTPTALSSQSTCVRRIKTQVPSVSLVSSNKGSNFFTICTAQKSKNVVNISQQYVTEFIEQILADSGNQNGAWCSRMQQAYNSFTESTSDIMPAAIRILCD